MWLDFYSIRAAVLNEHVEDWLAEDEIGLSWDALAALWAIDGRYFKAIYGEAMAFRYGGSDGSDRWKSENPDLVRFLAP